MNITIRKIRQKYDRDLGEVICSELRHEWDLDTISAHVIDLFLGRERWGLNAGRPTMKRRHDNRPAYFEMRHPAPTRSRPEGTRRVWWRDERLEARKRLEIHSKYAERWAIAEEMERKAVTDRRTGERFVYVQYGGRDCDQTETTSPPIRFPVDARLWVSRVKELHDGAEGPVWYWILDPVDVPNARHGSRDLALEAFEDGHPSTVRPRGPLTPAEA